MIYIYNTYNNVKEKKYKMRKKKYAQKLQKEGVVK